MIVGYGLTQRWVRRLSFQSSLFPRTPVSQFRKMTMTQAATELEVEIDASKNEIKAAYLAKAKKYHPDNNVRTIL